MFVEMFIIEVFFILLIIRSIQVMFIPLFLQLVFEVYETNDPTYHTGSDPEIILTISQNQDLFFILFTI